jgi:predicted O-methyltransferase YrrM
MNQVQAVIDRLEAMSKQGESYDEKGRHGWRNPIRADTGPLLEALVLANNPKFILEIGTAFGLSGCYLARRLDDKGKIVSIEWDKKTASEAQANFNEVAQELIL